MKFSGRGMRPCGHIVKPLPEPIIPENSVPIEWPEHDKFTALCKTPRGLFQVSGSRVVYVPHDTEAAMLYCGDERMMWLPGGYGILKPHVAEAYLEMWEDERRNTENTK